MSKTPTEKFQMIPTANLGIYGNQIIAYIQDINKSLQKLDQIRQMPNIIFDIESRGQDLWGKHVEAAKMYNKIMLEMERRCKKDLGFSFDYPQISKITSSIDDFLEKQIGNPMASEAEQRKAADEQIARAMPESLIKKGGHNLGKV